MSGDLIVRWEVTGHKGQGQLMARDLAITWMVWGNLNWPEVDHWVVRADGNRVSAGELLEWCHLIEAEFHNQRRSIDDGYIY